jgi:hypothetical protein
MNVFTAISKAFDKEHKKCRLIKALGLSCFHCLRFGHEPKACPRLDYKGDPERWWNGPDTGRSSKAIWRQLREGIAPTEKNTVPRDPDDFGRCHRLLEAIPGWRDRIGEMRSNSEWAGLAEAWDELEKLYEEELPSGSCPKLYARMTEILRGSGDALATSDEVLAELDKMVKR